MNFDSLPFGAQTSILGFLLVIVGWVIWLVLSGRLVPRSQLEDAQKTADRFEHAWQITQENQSNLTDVLSEMGVLADTFAHFIDSLPTNGHTENHR
jgi:hypothetical protein